MNMKLLYISVHFEYADLIERLLDQHDVVDYITYSMLEGRDEEGRHEGSQVHPGNFTVVQAQVPEDRIEPIFRKLSKFRDQKSAHNHLEALVLPIERRL